MSYFSTLTKTVKQTNGIQTLYENYQQNPNFGSPDDVFAELYVVTPPPPPPPPPP
jgi:hypothetical protein